MQQVRTAGGGGEEQSRKRLIHPRHIRVGTAAPRRENSIRTTSRDNRVTRSPDAIRASPARRTLPEVSLTRAQFFAL
jgi:hypothetical protein